MNTEVRADLRAKGPLTEIDLDVDVDTLDILPGAIAVYTDRHGHMVDDVRESLLDTVDELLSKGIHRVDARGGHVLYADGYRIVLSSDTEVVLAYATAHRERTLQQVREGVKSRLRDKAVNLDGLFDRLDDDRLDVLPIPPAALSALVDHTTSRQEEEDIRLCVRDAIAAALDELEGLDTKARLESGKYRREQDGRHVLAADGYVVSLRPDGLRVLAVVEGDGVDAMAPTAQARRVTVKRRKRDQGPDRAA